MANPKPYTLTRCRQLLAGCKKHAARCLAELTAMHLASSSYGGLTSEPLERSGDQLELIERLIYWTDSVAYWQAAIEHRESRNASRERFPANAA